MTTIAEAEGRASALEALVERIGRDFAGSKRGSER